MLATTAPAADPSLEELAKLFRSKSPAERIEGIEAAVAAIRKRNWAPGEPIVEAGGRVFARVGGSKGDIRILTLYVADPKTGELLWERVI